MLRRSVGDFAYVLQGYLRDICRTDFSKLTPGTDVPLQDPILAFPTCHTQKPADGDVVSKQFIAKPQATPAEKLQQHPAEPVSTRCQPVTTLPN